MSLSRNIKRYRKAIGLSQEDMGERLHIDQSAYSRLEGQETTCARCLARIASALGTTPNVLRTYHETHDSAPAESTTALPLTGEGLIRQQQQTIQAQAEEIQFLRQQVAHLQAVWHKDCGGGKRAVSPVVSR